MIEIGQQLKSLFIWNLGERIVRIVTFKNWVERGICIEETSILYHINPEGVVAQEGFNQSEVFPIKSSTDFSFDKDGPSFIKPEAFPVLAGNSVTSPAVSHFMSCNVNLRLVTYDDCW